MLRDKKDLFFCGSLEKRVEKTDGVVLARFLHLYRDYLKMEGIMSDNAEEWTALHVQLQQTLQKEVSMMRELLANMHQEELSLLLNDQGSLSQLLHDRTQLIDHLSTLRTTRLETAERIEKMTGDKTPEQMFPIEEESSMEILSLRDQLMALTEQMNRQKSQNQYLIDHPTEAKLAAPQNTARAKRKASVATYQIKK